MDGISLEPLQLKLGKQLTNRTECGYDYSYAYKYAI